MQSTEHLYTNAEELEIVTLENAIYEHEKMIWHLLWILFEPLRASVHLFSQYAITGFVLYCKRIAGTG